MDLHKINTPTTGVLQNYLLSDKPVFRNVDPEQYLTRYLETTTPSLKRYIARKGGKKLMSQQIIIDLMFLFDKFQCESKAQQKNVLNIAVDFLVQKKQQKASEWKASGINNKGYIERRHKILYEHVLNTLLKNSEERRKRELDEKLSKSRREAIKGKHSIYITGEVNLRDRKKAKVVKKV